MHTAIETSSQQMFAVVGSAYVSEHHGDELHRYLPASERTGTFNLNFDEVLKVLRSALSCRRHER